MREWPSGTVTQKEDRSTAFVDRIHVGRGNETEYHSGYDGRKVLGVEVECKLQQVTKATRKDRTSERATLRVNERVRGTMECSDTRRVARETSVVEGVKVDE